MSKQYLNPNRIENIKSKLIMRLQQIDYIASELGRLCIDAAEMEGIPDLSDSLQCIKERVASLLLMYNACIKVIDGAVNEYLRTEELLKRELSEILDMHSLLPEVSSIGIGVSSTYEAVQQVSFVLSGKIMLAPVSVPNPADVTPIVLIAGTEQEFPQQHMYAHAFKDISPVDFISMKADLPVGLVFDRIHISDVQYDIYSSILSPLAPPETLAIEHPAIIYRSDPFLLQAFASAAYTAIDFSLSMSLPSFKSAGEFYDYVSPVVYEYFPAVRIDQLAIGNLLYIEPLEIRTTESAIQGSALQSAESITSTAIDFSLSMPLPSFKSAWEFYDYVSPIVYEYFPAVRIDQLAIENLLYIEPLEIKTTESAIQSPALQSAESIAYTAIDFSLSMPLPSFKSASEFYDYVSPVVYEYFPAVRIDQLAIRDLFYIESPEIRTTESAIQSPALQSAEYILQGAIESILDVKKPVDKVEVWPWKTFSMALPFSPATFGSAEYENQIAGILRDDKNRITPKETAIIQRLYQQPMSEPEGISKGTVAAQAIIADMGILRDVLYGKDGFEAPAAVTVNDLLTIERFSLYDYLPLQPGIMDEMRIGAFDDVTSKTADIFPVGIQDEMDLPMIAFEDGNGNLVNSTIVPPSIEITHFETAARDEQLVVQTLAGEIVVDADTPLKREIAEAVLNGNIGNEEDILTEEYPTSSAQAIINEAINNADGDLEALKLVNNAVAVAAGACVVAATLANPRLTYNTGGSVPDTSSRKENQDVNGVNGYYAHKPDAVYAESIPDMGISDEKNRVIYKGDIYQSDGKAYYVSEIIYDPKDPNNGLITIDYYAEDGTRIQIGQPKGVRFLFKRLFEMFISVNGKTGNTEEEAMATITRQIKKITADLPENDLAERLPVLFEDEENIKHFYNSFIADTKQA